MPTRKRTRKSVLKALRSAESTVTPLMWLSGVRMCETCGVELPRVPRRTQVPTKLCWGCYERREACS